MGSEKLSTTGSFKCKKEIDDKELEKRAIEEIYREIAIKAVRAKEVGPSGWLDCPLKKPNKRFLTTTIKAVMHHNERKSNKEKFSSQKKLLELDYSKKLSRKHKFGDRKHLFKKPPES